MHTIKFNLKIRKVKCRCTHFSFTCMMYDEKLHKAGLDTRVWNTLFSNEFQDSLGY
ncbi:hypothetical protein Hanom_Chr12g01109811 [Helianthus anomalus]